MEHTKVKKIGIFFICTGRYRVFWQPFFQSAERYLFADSSRYEKHYFVLTDEEEKIPRHERVHTLHIEQEAWPFPTLKRWHYFLQAQEQYSWVTEMDYVYFFNATLSVVKPVAEELLPQADKTLVLTQFPSYPPSRFAEFPYERNSASEAYIKKGQGSSYFMGGLLGGKSTAFEEMCRELKQRTERDLKKKIIAICHDESQLNRYAVDYPEKITALPYTTTLIENKDGSLQGNPKKSAIVILEKSRPRWGGHAWLRGQLPNCITVKIKGGLGNQLWQYAAGLALQAKHAAEGNPVELYLDTTWFHSQKKRKFLLRQLLSLGQQAGVLRIAQANPDYPVYREPQEFSFDSELFAMAPAITLEGYYQHYRYFDLAQEQLRPQLQLRPLSQTLQNLHSEYQVVALHLRCGDYFQQEIKVIHGLAPLAYYRAALREIQKQVENPYILLFSDDTAWLTKHLVPDIEALNLPYSFAHNETKGDTLSDFSAMTQCRHFIIANSSYSALAALLSAKPDSIVFAPRLWNLALNIRSEQFLPSSWQPPAYKLYEGPIIETPAISLIIPVYNTESYLVRCLESVCQQTEQNIEIIVVDDASPDNSWAIIQDYVARDSRIRAIRHPENKHLGGARNTGIEAARGEWLLFLDSDDYLRLDAVEILLNASKEYSELELIIFGIWQVLPERGLRPFENMPSKPILLPDTLREFCTRKNMIIFHCACSKLWRRNLFENMRFPEHMSMEDLAVGPHLFAQLQAGKTLVLPERLYLYQHRDDSLSNYFNEQSARDFGRAFHLVQEFAVQLSPERHLLLENKMLQEFHCILQRKQSQDLEFLTALVEHVPKDFIAKGLWTLSNKLCETQQDHVKLQQNRWYRFGQLSRKRKLWVLAKALSKKLKVYGLLRPVAKIAKGILEKKK